jgi:chemotaxis protein CheD
VAGLRLRVDESLLPGDLGIYARPLQIKTIVGSCVALCLWDPVRKLAGLNHYLLPFGPSGSERDFRYGTSACRHLITTFLDRGGWKSRTYVALVGGGAPASHSEDGTVGAHNVTAALQVLREFGLSVHRRETGGLFGRKLLFFTGEGRLLVRTLARPLNDAG